MIVLMVSNCDCLFAAICMSIVVQLKLLCKALETWIPSDVSDEEAKKLSTKTYPELLSITNIRLCYEENYT